jgi:hypothetical protein
MLYGFLTSLTHAIFLTHLILLDLIALIVFRDELKFFLNLPLLYFRGSENSVPRCRAVLSQS